MLRPATFLLCVCLITCGNAADKAVSREEATVRQTYAKLAYAFDVHNVQETIQDYEQKGIDPAQVSLADAMSQIAEEKIHFELSDFTLGNISDIKGNYDDYVLEPDGKDTLAVATGTFDVREENKLVAIGITADVKWTSGQLTPQAAWKVPASQIVARPLDGVMYQRYASYRVILKFQGRERDYRALALFAPGNILIIDLVTGNSALTFFAKRETDVSPKTLARTASRKNPIAKEWLRSNPPPSVPR